MRHTVTSRRTHVCDRPISYHHRNGRRIGNGVSRVEQLFEIVVFASRWIQAPLYAGLIIAECLYAYKFLTELGDGARASA